MAMSMMSMTASMTANYIRTITGNKGEKRYSASLCGEGVPATANYHDDYMPISGTFIIDPMASAYTTTVYGDYTDGNDPDRVQIYE